MREVERRQTFFKDQISEGIVVLRKIEEAEMRELEKGAVRNNGSFQLTTT